MYVYNRLKRIYKKETVVDKINANTRVSPYRIMWTFVLDILEMFITLIHIGFYDNGRSQS